MEIVPVHKRNLDILLCQQLAEFDAAESAADDHDTRFIAGHNRTSEIFGTSLTVFLFYP